MSSKSAVQAKATVSAPARSIQIDIETLYGVSLSTGHRAATKLGAVKVGAVKT